MGALGWRVSSQTPCKWLGWLRIGGKELETSVIGDMTVASAGTREHLRVGIARKEEVYRVIATAPIERGEPILEIRGVFVQHPSRYSVQVEDDLHVELPLVEGLTQEPDRHPWRYLNHSCDPNAALVGLGLVAIKSIRQWEEVTFDYNTTEFQMANPFVCRCGHCSGALIRGFKFLTPRQQRDLYPRLAVHLRRRLDSNGTC